MGVWDRVFLFLYSLCIIVLVFVGGFFGLVLEMPSLFGGEIFPLEFEGGIWLNIVLITLGLCLFLLSLRFIYLSFIQNSISEDGIVQETEIGAVHISLVTIEEIVVRAAKQVKGVFNLRARVRYHEEGSNVSIGLKIEIDGKRSIQSLSEELQKVVKERVEAIAGVEVDQVSVFIAQTHKSNQNRLRVS